MESALSPKFQAQSYRHVIFHFCRACGLNCAAASFPFHAAMFLGCQACPSVFMDAPWLHYAFAKQMRKNNRLCIVMTIGSSKDDIHDVSLSNIDESKEIMDNTFANKLKKHVAFKARAESTRTLLVCAWCFFPHHLLLCKDEGQTICPTCGSTRAPPTDQSSPTPFARRETSRKVPLTTVILEQQRGCTWFRQVVPASAVLVKWSNLQIFG